MIVWVASEVSTFTQYIGFLSHHCFYFNWSSQFTFRFSLEKHRNNFFFYCCNFSRCCSPSTQHLQVTCCPSKRDSRAPTQDGREHSLGESRPDTPRVRRVALTTVTGNLFLCSTMKVLATAWSWKNAHAWISLLKFTVPQNPIKQPKSIKLFMYSRLWTAGSDIYVGLVPVTVTIPLSVFHFSAIQLKVKFKPSYSQWTLKNETFIGL